MNEIVIGRNVPDRKSYGTKGTILLGKHYIQMGQTTSLSNPVFLDVVRSHVVFVCGKRGSGKSYTMGVIAEGISDLPRDIRQNISVILLDTMGIYWTMKYPNRKDEELLKKWDMDPKALDVKIYTPTGYFKQYRKKGIPTDSAFAIKPSELAPGDWCMALGIDREGPIGVMIERIVHELKESGKEYDLKDIIKAIKDDKEADKVTLDGAKNRFLNAKNWGVFDKKGTPIEELAKPGQVTVLDVSCYATEEDGWNIKSLVIGLIAEKLFIERMVSRKTEEYKIVHKSMNVFGDSDEDKKDRPMVWLIIDEAHEFLPNQGKTLATEPLITILREGRQPGISLILASQQPGKIHTDVMTQADTVISHRITAKIDTDALGTLMQSYMRKGLPEELDRLPREDGAAIVFDDTNEKMYPIRVRPRFTWHGGAAPSAIPEEEELEL